MVERKINYNFWTTTTEHDQQKICINNIGEKEGIEKKRIGNIYFKVKNGLLSIKKRGKNIANSIVR